MNSRPSLARDVELWPQDDETGESVSEPFHVGAAMTVGQQVQVRLAVENEFSRRGGPTLGAGGLTGRASARSP